jgi:hypothetical protein
MQVDNPMWFVLRRREHTLKTQGRDVAGTAQCYDRPTLVVDDPTLEL